MKNKKNFLYVQLGAIGVFIAVIYSSTFVWLYERYTSADTYYSHGFLVPFVTGFLIWFKRKELALIPMQGNAWGLVLVVIALLLHSASVITDVFFVSGFSIMLLLFGVSLFMFGNALTKQILFPLSFLAFMFPLPLVVINAISFPLKMLVTKVSVFILKTTLNIPMKNEGFQIFFPNASLVVENPCSGLRSLISLLALGSIFAYLLKAPLFKRFAFFLWAIPIALVTNLLRVILLCLGVFVYGEHMAKGFFHDFTGYLVFLVAFAALFALRRKFQC
jgi:exosortase